MSLPASDIRIVVPVYNSSNTICDCVDAILKAIAFCKSWELVVVDNEENSNLEILLKNYAITLIKRTDSKSAAYARNEGAKEFENGILVFIDSDVIVETPCIERLVQPIISKSCDATIGNYSSNLNNLSFAQKYKQLYIRHIYDRNSNGIKNDFWTAIAAVDAVTFSKLNGFDIKFKGANGEDQEFGIRLTKNNFKVLAVKSANGQHRNPYSVSGIVKNDFRKGVTAIKNSFTNKVSLSDNRHAQIADMMAVIFGTLSVFSFGFGFLSVYFWYAAIILLASWFFCRAQLSYFFIINGGILFFIEALGLMFILDLVRFTCVTHAIFKYKIMNKIFNRSNEKLSIITNVTR